jgi:hypothetical protein
MDLEQQKKFKLTVKGFEPEIKKILPTMVINPGRMVKEKDVKRHVKQEGVYPIPIPSMYTSEKAAQAT